MANCPFWSNKQKKVSCYSECPMSKEHTLEECVFSLYLNSINGEKEKFKPVKYNKPTIELEFNEVEDDMIGNLRYLTNY